jgi:hypothetical protein
MEQPIGLVLIQELLALQVLKGRQVLRVLRVLREQQEIQELKVL